MTDNVIPFDRSRRAKEKQQATPPALPPGQQHLHAKTRRAAPQARALAAKQSAGDRDKYARARILQEEERLLRDERPVPAWITMALDGEGLDGPEVDIACGAVGPAVDLWECGVEVPSPEQIRLLAKLTGCSVAFFFQPFEPGPILPGMFICSTGRPGSQSCLSPAPDVIDEHGVLHYGGEPRRTPPAAVQGTLF